MIKIKRYLAALMSSILIMGGITPISAAETSSIGNSSSLGSNLILNYDFAYTSGTTVRDSSGKGNDGIIKGSGATVADGVLNLPGGAAGSSAAYVQLPTGMFDGKNTLTISTWLKNETGKGNYSAMFFGTATTPYPSQYWLLNPCNPSGYLKSVITNNLSTGSPWNTEYGFSPTVTAQGMVGPTTDNNWHLYTTIIQPGSITAYYDDKKIGTVPTSRNISDFGSSLVAYIGRSTYNDIFYKGGIKNVKVYDTAITDQDVINEYYSNISDEQVNAILEKDISAVKIPTTTIFDLILPSKGNSGSTIVWNSSNTDVISNDGKVVRSSANDVTVNLTATFSLGLISKTKSYTVNVLANTDEKIVGYLADSYNLGINYAADDIILPASYEGANIKWTGSDYISSEGKITRPDTETKTKIQAEFTYGTAKTTRYYEVTVVAKTYATILTYVVSGNTDRTDTLHYAESIDGNTYTALHNNTGILYAAKGNKASAQMGSPTLFRKPDGKYGLIASDDNNSTSVFLWDSSDLINFTNGRSVVLNSLGIKVKNPICKYDNSILSYRIYFEGSDGKAYYVTTSDFSTFSSPIEAQYVKESVSGVLPAGAIEAGIFKVTKAEYDAIHNKYSRITNTGVKSLPDIKVIAGAEVKLPSKVTATYSDGSSKDMGVIWNTDGMDFTKPGSYTVKGTVQQIKYANPLIEERADPYCIYNEEDGYYYFIGSYPTYNNSDDNQGIGYDRLALRRAKTIQELSSAQEVIIWDEHNDPTYNRYIWAPELHKIGDSWYIITTSSTSTNKWGIRPTFLKCSSSKDGGLLKPENWSVVGQMKTIAGDDACTGFSLDMTYFESGGKSYVVWPEAKNGGTSDLWIATIDPSNPTQLTSKAMRLTYPEFGWEHGGSTWVNEGPAVIKNKSKVYLAFSAAAVDDTYCIGMLTADDNADLTNPSNWTKNPYPILTSSDFNNQEYGPGHNSFTIDQFGNPVLVYHARLPKDQWTGDGGLNDPGRHARVKNINFAADGSPILNMTYEEELKDEYKSVTVTVVVENILEKVLTGITVTMPAKTEYLVGDVIDAAGMTVTAKYSDESSEIISEGYSLSGFDSTTAGTKTVTVSYEGKTATFQVTVREKQATEKTLVSISVTAPTKTEYLVGDTLTPEGITVMAKYSDDSSKTISEGYSLSGFDSTTAGLKIVTVTYEGKTAAFEVTVKEKPQNSGTTNTKVENPKTGDSGGMARIPMLSIIVLSIIVSVVASKRKYSLLKKN
jgi:GH43 family beta-xylosidase